MSRTPIPIDEKLVYELAKAHCTQAEIAAACKVSVDTIQRRFSEIITQAADEGKSSIKRAFFKKASSGHVSAMIFFLKTQCGWKERLVHEGPGGEPLPAIPLFPSMTTAQAKEEMKKRLKVVSEKP